MELLGVFLGIIALAVGVYHVVEIRRALANLAMVQSSISTQYLGKFPRFLKDIVDLVNGARNNLVIFCDYPGYGEFSDPAKALEYQQAIERQKRANVNIDFTCLDATTRKKNISDQFAGQDWIDWDKDEEKREKVLRFLRNSGHSDLQKATITDVIDALHALDERLLSEPYLKPVRQIVLHMPIYFWIADEQKAIFTIPTVGRSFEHGFLTSDHALILALLEMYERYKKAATAALPPAKEEPLPAGTPAPSVPAGTNHE
jgi:hypothetical protein